MDPLEAQLQGQIDQSRRFFWHRLRWKLVESRLPASGPFQLLDVGAGAGLVGEYLGRHRPSATYRFIEPIDSLRRHLEKRFGEDANAEHLRSYETMDVVTLLDVLEHQEDDYGFLEGLLQRMRPGAILVLTVPALPGLWSAWDVGLGHHRRYRKDSLRQVLSRSPVRMEEVNYLFPELVPAAFIRRLRRPASRLGATEEFQFPRVAGWANELLFGIGSMTSSLRFLWPFGTSLLAVVRRTNCPDRSSGL